MGGEWTFAEKPVLDYLQSIGYRYLKPAEHDKNRDGDNHVIFKPILTDALKRINGLSDRDTEAAYQELAGKSDNEEWTHILRGNYSRMVEGHNTKQTIRLIDFLNPANNTFTVTSQLYVKSEKPRIPDVVVYINGIPVIVIEAKSPLNWKNKTGEAFAQIKQYERDVPRLFYTNQFNIITDGTNCLYGSTGSPAKFYGTWKDPWPRNSAEFGSALEQGLWSLLEPSRLLDLIAHFIVFEREDGRVIKKVCRYQQFRAVNKIVHRVAEENKRRGLIWHTQGSGKSLTMVFAALKLKKHQTVNSPALANPNIMVLTDRIDLDDQISDTFEACGLPNPERIKSVKDLRELLHTQAEGLMVLATIFKFQGSKKAIENSRNWIVLVDECHRTQEKDLGAYLRATLPDAQFFGFTGTPIKKTDKDTYANFGVEGEGYLDKYGIDDAVADGATVPIARTNRVDSPEKRNGLIVDYIGVSKNLDKALESYREEDVKNAMRPLDDLLSALRGAHAEVMSEVKPFKGKGPDIKAEIDSYLKSIKGQKDKWYIFRQKARDFVAAYEALSPEPTTLEFLSDLKWVDQCLRYGSQAMEQKESLDHFEYSRKIRDMLESHVQATGLSTTIKLRKITDPDFWEDFELGKKTSEELQQAAIRKSTELRKVTSERIDQNPVRYGKFSDRLREIIKRLETAQVNLAAELKAMEELAKAIEEEDKAHEGSGLSAEAYGVYKILEELGERVNDNRLQQLAQAINDLYANNQTAPRLWQSRDQLKKSLRQDVRSQLHAAGIPNIKNVAEQIEEFALKHHAKV